MSDTLYEDQLSPDAYVLDVTPGNSAVDLAAVNSAAFHVHRRSDGSITTWAAAITNQTPTTLTLTYLLAAGEIDTVRGSYDIYARLTFSGSTYVRTATRVLVVKGKYEV